MCQIQKKNPNEAFIQVSADCFPLPDASSIGGAEDHFHIERYRG